MYGRVEGENPRRAMIRGGLELLLEEVDAFATAEFVSEDGGASLWRVRRHSKASAEHTAKALELQANVVISDTGGRGISSVAVEGACVMISIAHVRG